MIESIFASLSTGIIYGIGAVGLGLIYRYLKFPDFTTIISFIAGAAIMAVMSKINIALALFLSIIIGGMLGTITYFQIRCLKVNNILAGIITNIGAMSLVFLFTDNQAVVNTAPEISSIFDKLLAIKFSWWNIIKLGSIGFFLCWLISNIFKTRYGLYILGLLGTENYIAYRHHNKEKARFILHTLGNSIISFSGALLTIQNTSFNVHGTPDFLYIALSGYVLSSFLIQLSNSFNKNYLDRDNKITGNVFVKMYLSFREILSKNDEEPVKIRSFLFLIIVGTTLVNAIFQYIDMNHGEDNRVSYFYKAFIFLSVLFLGNIEKKNSNKQI